MCLFLQNKCENILPIVNYFVTLQCQKGRENPASNAIVPPTYLRLTSDLTLTDKVGVGTRGGWSEELRVKSEELRVKS